MGKSNESECCEKKAEPPRQLVAELEQMGSLVVRLTQQQATVVQRLEPLLSTSVEEVMQERPEGMPGAENGVAPYAHKLSAIGMDAQNILAVYERLLKVLEI